MRPFAQMRPAGRPQAPVGAMLCLALVLPIAGARADDPPEPTPQADAAATIELIDTPAAAEQVPVATRFETQLLFDTLLEQQRYEDAVPAGELLVKLTAEEFGENSREVAKVLTELGNAQRRLGDHTAAETTLLHAIEIIRGYDGVFSVEAIEPLVDLGSNYYDSRNYVSALSVFSEARSINRRAFGILNLDQIPIADRMTETLLSMGKLDDANEQQLDALQIAERTYGSNSLELLGPLYKYAGWLRRIGHLTDERMQYQRAIEIITDNGGDNSALLAPPLREFGNSLRLQKVEDGQGYAALKRALEVLEAQPQQDALAIAATLRDLGDWQTAFTSTGAQPEEYGEAWDLLGQLDNGDDLRRAWFSGGEYVLYEPMSLRDLSTDPDSPEGFVLVRLDVDESGRPDNVVVLESEPAGLKDEAALRSVRRSRFRPKIEDGEFVRATGIAKRFNYRYSPDEKGN